MNSNDKIRVAVVGGGRNSEHEVSLASAAAVGKALQNSGYQVVRLTIDRTGVWRDEELRPIGLAGAVRVIDTCDVVVPMLHGVHGEDGTLAALCELAQVLRRLRRAGGRGGDGQMADQARRPVPGDCGGARGHSDQKHRFVIYLHPPSGGQTGFGGFQSWGFVD